MASDRPNGAVVVYTKAIQLLPRPSQESLLGQFSGAFEANVSALEASLDRTGRDAPTIDLILSELGVRPKTVPVEAALLDAWFDAHAARTCDGGASSLPGTYPSLRQRPYNWALSQYRNAIDDLRGALGPSWPYGKAPLLL